MMRHRNFNKRVFKMETPNLDQNSSQFPASRKRGWAAIGAAAFFGGMFVASPFVGLFTVGVLIVPVMLEIHAKGKDNILNRAWKEVRPSVQLVQSDVMTLLGLEGRRRRREQPAVPAARQEVRQASELGTKNLKGSFKPEQQQQPTTGPEKAPKPENF
jgi:hypothetical protein